MSPLPTINTWNKFQSVLGSASTATYSGSIPTHPSIPFNVDTQQYTYAAATSGSRRAHPSAVSSPTNSRTASFHTQDPELEKELQDLKTQVQTLISAAHTSPASSTTSSLKSTKSKQEDELELKISRLETLVVSQMEVIANLRKTMETLNAKLNHNSNDTSVTTNSYCKQAKTGQSPRKSKHKNRHTHSSDSGSDQDMAKPPNPGKDNLSTQSQHDNTSHASMDDAAGELDGGINDDDISETMAQEYEANIATISSPSRSTSPEAQNINHDL